MLTKYDTRLLCLEPKATPIFNFPRAKGVFGPFQLQLCGTKTKPCSRLQHIASSETLLNAILKPWEQVQQSNKLGNKASKNKTEKIGKCLGRTNESNSSTEVPQPHLYKDSNPAALLLLGTFRWAESSAVSIN
jgi:hypothetical protein